MLKQEAYSLLGLTPDASDDQAKKKFRELSKTLHPDVNKDSDATEKFQKISQAYDCIKEKKFDDNQSMQDFSGFGGFQGGFPGGFNIHDFFSNHFGQDREDQPPIEVSVVISFKEAIFGCKKELSFNRKTKCQSCNGQGHIKLNNGCKQCGGSGMFTRQSGNMVFQQQCPKCHGRSQHESCKTCNTEGSQDSTTNISVNIPAGISNNTLRLAGIGHFVSNSHFGDRHADVYVHVSVIAEDGLRQENNDVVSDLSISLLDAVMGCKKSIRTLDGEKEIEIKPSSKNKEEIYIPNLGVARVGNHRVILNVEYPSNTDKLINFLKESY